MNLKREFKERIEVQRQMPTNDLENMPTLIVRKESIQAGDYEFPYNGDN